MVDLNGKINWSSNRVREGNTKRKREARATTDRAALFEFTSIGKEGKQ